MSRVALATTAAVADPDLEVLAASLGARGCEAKLVAWDAEAVDWSEFDLTVIRSTWDYAPRVAAFLRWCDAIDHLCNEAAVVAWNADKHYLAELAGRGVPVIDTAYATGGREAVLPDGAVVVKPSVGGGSRGVKRFGAEEHDAARAHVDELASLGVGAMVQPYLSEIERGETAVVVIEGAVSHAVTKFAPLGLEATSQPAGPLAVLPTVPSTAELAVVEAVLDALPWSDPLCYARIDLVATSSGPVVIEVELIEPFLFLTSQDDAADTFAAAIVGRLEHRVG